ncbi:MAG: UpxY family transcription antiterminator [Ferruginibacter sp.]|nr:UpxY family transcription antiterminator [Ferruginibacter sp.]
MQKNWHAVYTKPQSEKKVAALLRKKKIEVYVPMVYVKVNTFMGHKFVFEPLFKSIVFVNVEQQDVNTLKQTSGVINLLYWLGKPAIIAEPEITAIKEFIENYKDIKLMPSYVNKKEEISLDNDGAAYSIDGRLYAVKNKSIKVNLPSLGYSLVAEMDESGIFVQEIPGLNNYRFAHS